MDFLKRTAVACVAITAAAPANAAVVFDVVRLSDSVAEITGSGTFDDVVGLGGGVVLEDANSTGGAGEDAFTGSMSAGGHDLDFVFAMFGQEDLLFGFDGLIVPGDALTGTVTVTLDETFAAVGTSGRVFNASSTGATLGSYAVREPDAAVIPLPAGLPLLVGGLGALALLRRRRG